MSENTYQVEYSTTDRATCKDAKCKQKIGKGVLRIGKEAPSPFGDDTMLNWYHASCAFRALTRAKGSTKKIDDMDDLVGHEGISAADKKLLTRMINGEQLWTESGWKASTASSKSASSTKAAPAKKRKASASPKPAKKTKGGSSGKTYLEFYGSKFWEISVDGTATNIRFGKVGCSGATQTKSWGSHASALTQMEKQIKSKKRKGYKEAGDGGSDDEEEDDDEEEEEEDEKSEASSSSSEAEDDIDWQWQDEDNKWHSYGPEQQKGLLTAMKAGRLFYKFDLGSNSYRIHLKLRYQVNLETAVKRKVRVK